MDSLWFTKFKNHNKRDNLSMDLLLKLDIHLSVHIIELLKNIIEFKLDAGNKLSIITYTPTIKSITNEEFIIWLQYDSIKDIYNVFNKLKDNSCDECYHFINYYNEEYIDLIQNYISSKGDIYNLLNSIELYLLYNK